MAKLIAVFNIKGGVSKTTTTVNLAYLAASYGYKTLIWDMDPQGAASFYFRVKDKVKGGLNGLLKSKKEVYQRIKGTDYRNLEILPADQSYRLMDQELRNARRKSARDVRNILKPLMDEYDVILVDCPPNLSESVAGLISGADFLLVPAIPTILSLRTVEQLFKFMNTSLKTRPETRIFFSQVEKRRAMHQEIIEKFILKNSDFAFHTLIPISSELEKMGVSLEPFPKTSPSHHITQLYQMLWEEIESELALTRPSILGFSS